MKKLITVIITVIVSIVVIFTMVRCNKTNDTKQFESTIPARAIMDDDYGFVECSAIENLYTGKMIATNDIYDNNTRCWSIMFKYCDKDYIILKVIYRDFDNNFSESFRILPRDSVAIYI